MSEPYGWQHPPASSPQPCPRPCPQSYPQSYPRPCPQQQPSPGDAPPPTDTRGRNERMAALNLEPGETPLMYAVVVPAKGAKGIGVYAHGMRPVTEPLRRAVMDLGSSHGHAGSIAAGLPADSGKAKLPRITDRRVGLVGTTDGAPWFEVPRSWVAGVERRPRLQLMARFRLHFADGSWLAFSTMRRRTTEGIAGHLGPLSPSAPAPPPWVR